jgi:uncharacterized small protein (TIGR04563 family)
MRVPVFLQEGRGALATIVLEGECGYFTPTRNHTGHDGLTQCKRAIENGVHMSGSDKRKQSLYFPEAMLKEIQEEASRQDRSLSWIVQKAWQFARKEIMRYPSVNDFSDEDAQQASE